ncbi:MAG: reverse transcriptase domain-containing protein [Coxiella-like endosymbiont]
MSRKLLKLENIVKNGVPQGSVICPLLINMHVNELPQFASKCRLLQYANDTVLLSNHSCFDTCVYSLQYNATSVISWCMTTELLIIQIKYILCFPNPLKKFILLNPFFFMTRNV